MENEQNGNIKAEYGKQIIRELSKELRNVLGAGFSVSNLFNMRKFYITYPKFQTVSGKLSWSHYCELLSIQMKMKEIFMKKNVLTQTGVLEN